jgi:hypothetical protein
VNTLSSFVSRRRHALAVAGLVALASCADAAQPTRVVVTVRADRMTDERARQLYLSVVRGAPGMESRLVYESTVDAEFPFVIELTPGQNQPSQPYQLDVRAIDAQGPFVRASLRSSYVAEQTRYVTLLLEDDCIATSCGADSTCHAGACVDSQIDPSVLGSDPERPPRSVDLLGPFDPLGRVDASAPAATDAGQPVARPEPALADAALALPMQPSEQDSSPPSADDDASVAALPDAGSPAPIPDPPLDAGRAQQPPDAGSPPPQPPADAGSPMPTRPPPDAGSPMSAQPPPDAGNSALSCMPRGTWSFHYVETGGTCRMGDLDLAFAFYGKLSDSIIRENAGCGPVVSLSADGCTLTYRVECPAVAGARAYDETGSARMLAPDRIVGEMNQVYYDSAGTTCTTAGKFEMAPVSD